MVLQQLIVQMQTVVVSTPLPPPLINVLKVPTPLSLPSGPGSVTYNYTVTNIGTVAMSKYNS